MRTKVFCIVFLILCCFLCSGSSAVEVSAPPPTLDQLRADYDQFWSTLALSFPFYPLLGDEENLALIRDSNRQLIGPRIKDSQGLFALLNAVIHQMNRISHFEMLGPGLYEGYRESALQNNLLEKTLLLDSQTQAIYALLAENDRSTGQNQTPNLTEMSYYPDIQTAYFRFPSFATPIVDKTEDSPLAVFLEEHPSAEHVIIDITGNSGGNSDVWQQMIVSAFSQEHIWTTKAFLRITPQTDWLYAHKHLQGIASLEACEVPPFVRDYHMTHYSSEVLSFPMKDYAGKQTGKAVTRWLLVDGEVFSSADSFAKFCKDTGFAILVGSNTRGGGSLIRGAAVCRLNHTGLLFRFPVESYENERGQASALEGTAPDFFVLPASTPLETCFRLIKEGLYSCPGE